MTDFDAIAVGRRVLTTEADALKLQADTLGEAFAKAVDLLFAAKGRIICTGIGKSGHVAKKIAATFASTGAPAFFVHANEASHGDLGMIADGDVILALSKSGQNQELADILAYSRRFHIPLIALTAAPDSPLGQAADVVLQLADAAEVTAEVKAPTTSTTLQIALGDALAVSLLERRGFTAKDFKTFHPGGKLGAMLRTVGDLMHGAEELPLVSQNTPMTEALLVMTSKAFGIVGVTGPDGALQGVITDGDLRRHIESLMTQTAGEVMTPGPKKSAPPGMLASEALALMSDPLPMVTVLFVIDAGKPVGILRIHDLIRAGV
ncbi:MAG: KpsF/GutQ family sugar-phosphate isomerase [Pseudomonadota bacterium]|uniref:KpsF/GutQ family sugar-phosphate isomerase n=1 Tax=unclassified Phenylobacterium TaxID=2640670 RepID=UPI000700E8DC|nr:MULTISPECIES: KpsF/GutQ family sugar-phosphate isomerase [unclassified Phenylobacterium]KRB51571.1 D-arabinose 5-phosphate [Phenylobacterium sp. Root700]MBT9473434.1 KpsF/GutQ family sugar-phosphate isomerase [Phenylobacterium sp.]